MKVVLSDEQKQELTTMMTDVQSVSWNSVPEEAKKQISANHYVIDKLQAAFIDKDSNLYKALVKTGYKYYSWGPQLLSRPNTYDGSHGLFIAYYCSDNPLIYTYHEQVIKILNVFGSKQTKRAKANTLDHTSNAYQTFLNHMVKSTDKVNKVYPNPKPRKHRFDVLDWLALYSGIIQGERNHDDNPYNNL